jgi:hypothetical protein
VRLRVAIVLATVLLGGSAHAQAPELQRDAALPNEARSEEADANDAQVSDSEAAGADTQAPASAATASEAPEGEAAAAQPQPSEAQATAAQATAAPAFDAQTTEAPTHEPQVDLQAARAAQLDRRLAAVQAERDGLTRTWALLVLGTGLAALVVASSVGIGTALSCDDSCDSAAWIGPTVLVGMGLATIGAVGLVATDHDIDQVELRRSHIERQRQQVELSGALSPKLNVRVAF